MAVGQNLRSDGLPLPDQKSAEKAVMAIGLHYLGANELIARKN
jgi:hypothetical protein